ncbi:MAG: hypothetical protein QOF40_333 [Actinomycetota bacterium]|nr:hypothetical protein [Actinomycetota bacterium]
MAASYALAGYDPGSGRPIMAAMAKILLQTTIPPVDDDWNVGRFSLLADELRAAGHDVTARNRDEGDHDDAVLGALDTSDYDELWLMAVDNGNGLTKSDAEGILRFREVGGGVLTARDHEDLGACLCRLGTLGRVNHFNRFNPEPDLVPDDQDNPNIAPPNYHSGANGDYQAVTVEGPVHDLLQTGKTDSGQIEWFPAHPHEGAVSAPTEYDFARPLAQGRSAVTGKPFNLAVVLDGESAADGNSQGRAVAASTFHHFADYNWDIDRGAPSFVTDAPGSEMKQEPSRLEIYKDYVRNLARWLAPRRDTR